MTVLWWISSISVWRSDLSRSSALPVSRPSRCNSLMRRSWMEMCPLDMLLDASQIVSCSRAWAGRPP
jgi:hypothetical protein